MPRTIQTLRDVVDWGLCTGCGACLVACERQGLALVDDLRRGRRIAFTDPACANCTRCLEVCPGAALDGAGATDDEPDEAALDTEFGRVYEIWSGYATDPQIRRAASSGGLLTALALYCLEREEMAGVLHTGADAGQPWRNQSVISTTRAQLLGHAGSRYAPSSPCAGLLDGGDELRPLVFIGKPCDVAGVHHLMAQDDRLQHRIGLNLTFFCAGTPATQATLDLLAQQNIPAATVTGLRYRGDGWPGGFRAQTRHGETACFVEYDKAWAFLAKQRPLRCHLCPDGLGRYGDLACGDAWHEFGLPGDPGRSLVLVRTRRGQRILHRAQAAGYVTLEPAVARDVQAAQSGLLQRRRLLFGRLLAMRLLRVPIPRFTGFGLFRAWWALPLAERLRTIGGTLYRIVKRRQWRRRGETAGASATLDPAPARAPVRDDEPMPLRSAS
jgi:coenzyme F420 hydrogenase subunit beta